MLRIISIENQTETQIPLVNETKNNSANTFK